MLKQARIWFRIASMVTLFAVIYYVAGYRLVYFLLTNNARTEAHVAIKNKQVVLERLTISESEYKSLKWTEANREFSYNEELYDIVSNINLDGQHIITAYCDKNESQWAKALDNFVKQIFPSDNSRPDKNMENIISAFHKDSIPVTAIKILSPDATMVTICWHSVDIHSRYSAKGIWHPPTCC
jgi:hypothetical protein